MKPTYHNQDLIAYLLGLLPEAQTEHFDELSFTDDDFADALKATEKDLVDAYVNGELPDANLEKFKSHYLASPLRRQKVEFAQAFQAFAGQNETPAKAENKAEEPSTKSAISGFFSALNIFSNPNPLLRFGAAAAVLILMILGGVWLLTIFLNPPKDRIEVKKETPTPNNNQPLPNQVKESPTVNAGTPEPEVASVNIENKTPKPVPTNTPAIPEPKPTPKPVQTPPASPGITLAFVLAPPLRDGNTPNLSIPEKAQAVKIGLQLEADEYPAYRVALLDQAGQNVWQSGRLRSKSGGENKTLNLQFPAKLLKSQIYSLTVTGLKPTGEAEIISNYPFRAVIK